MTHHTLAVIGTAGRKEDQQLLTHAHYARMVKGTISLISHLQLDPVHLKLVSGGAAWADHIVVTLAIMGVVRFEHVTLYLPTPFSEHGFEGDDPKMAKTASTSNYYHRLFSNKVGIDSFAQIMEIGNRGAILEPGKGNFFARNAMVARSVTPDGTLLAFTTGDPSYSQLPWSAKPFLADTTAHVAGLKDGGSAHTWNTAQCSKWHAKLGPIDNLNDYV